MTWLSKTKEEVAGMGPATMPFEHEDDHALLEEVIQKYVERMQVRAIEDRAILL